MKTARWIGVMALSGMTLFVGCGDDETTEGGVSGAGGTAGTAGKAGTAGQAGTAGTSQGGAAGQAGTAGTAGTAGAPQGGAAGTAGTGGLDAGADAPDAAAQADAADAEAGADASLDVSGQDALPDTSVEVGPDAPMDVTLIDIEMPDVDGGCQPPTCQSCCALLSAPGTAEVMALITQCACGDAGQCVTECPNNVCADPPQDIEGTCGICVETHCMAQVVLSCTTPGCQAVAACLNTCL